MVDLDALERRCRTANNPTAPAWTDWNWAISTSGVSLLALIAELRAARKVVGAAQAMRPSVDDYNNDWVMSIEEALTEYEALVT